MSTLLLGIQTALQVTLKGKIKIVITIMKDAKKDEYWGTSVRRFLTDGESKFNQEGTVYINLRDVEDREKVIKIIRHELTHLIDDKIDLEKALEIVNIENKGNLNA